MEFSEVFNFLASVPVWAWVIGAIIVLISFGDRKLWEYEVKFPFKNNVGRGEVEFKCLKKKGSSIEVELQLEPELHNKSIAIYLNKTLVYSISEQTNNGQPIRLTEKTAFQKPNEGDEVVVEISGREIFSGQLVLD